MEQAPQPFTRLPDLRRELEIYRLRYGLGRLQEPVERLDASIERRMTRRQAVANEMAGLRGRLGELAAELAVIDTEIAGCERGMEALVADIVEKVRIEFGEAWSPAPVVGFRMWDLRDGGLFGAANVRWHRRWLVAECLSTSTEIDIPHTWERCGPPSCGIYATKELQALLPERGARRYDLALGVVALSGKVVEHELGYRAERAEVLALAVVSGPLLLTADTPEELDAVFRDPENRLHDLGARHSRALPRAIAYLQERSRSAWTSVDSCE